MKLYKYILPSLLLFATTGHAFTIIESVLMSLSCKPVIFIPDSLFGKEDNIQVDLSAYLTNPTTSDSLVYSNQITLSNTAYFEYLGHISFDPLDTIGSRQHAYRLIFNDYYMPAGAFTLLYIDLSYLNEPILSQFRILRNCLQCNVCPNRFALYSLYGMVPLFTFGEPIPYDGYSGAYGNLGHYQQQVIRQMLNWLIDNDQPGVSDYLDVFNSDNIDLPVPDAFCNSEWFSVSGISCSCSQDLWQVANMIQPTLKMIYENPVLLGDLLEQLQMGFLTNCFCGANYWVYLHSNFEETGYSIDFIPFQQGLPIVQAEIVFEQDTSYSAIAYSYGWPLDQGIEYEGEGVFNYLNGFQPLHNNSDSTYHFSTALSATGDSLYAGFPVRVTVSPDTAVGYSFYRNGQPVQDSSIHFSTIAPVAAGDTIVVITHINEASTFFTVYCSMQNQGVVCDTISFPVNQCTGTDTLIIPSLPELPGLYFRSRRSGPWNEGVTWQASHDSLTWFTSNAWPNERAMSILIREGDTISFPAGFNSLSIAGHLNVQGKLRYDSLSNTRIYFTDTLDQYITTADTLLIKRLNINKGDSAHLFLSGMLAIEDSLLFVKGIVYPDSLSAVIFGDTAIAFGASDTSYINGTVLKSGMEAFNFPVGAGGSYSPVGLSNTTNISAVFQVRFKNDTIGAPFTAYDYTLRDTSLNYINDCGYWELEQLEGADSVQVKLGWAASPCALSNPEDVNIVAWGGSQWENMGNGGFSGGVISGSVRTAGKHLVNNFQKWGLGGGNQPLGQPMEGFHCYFGSPDGQSVYACGSLITMSISIPSNIKSVTLTYPNTFRIKETFPVLQDEGNSPNTEFTINGIGTIPAGALRNHTFKVPQETSVIIVTLEYTNCNVHDNIYSSNFDLLLFDCDGIHENESFQQAFLHSLNGFTLIESQSMARLFNNTNTGVKLQTTQDHANIQGNPGDVVCRDFKVIVNSQNIHSFYLKITPESDATHNNLYVLVNDNPVELLNFTTESNFTIDLDEHPEYSSTTGNTRTINFRQCVTLKCLQNGSDRKLTTVSAGLKCDCVKDVVANPLTLNAVVGKNPTFSFISNTLTPTDANTIAPCSGNYFYDIRIDVSNSTANLTHITIPLDTRFFQVTGLSIGVPGVLSPISITGLVNTSNPVNSTISIPVDELFNSANPWAGFIPSFNSTTGAWFAIDDVSDKIELLIRVSLSYDCVTDMECVSPVVSLTSTIPSNNRILLSYENTCSNPTQEHVGLNFITGKTPHTATIIGGTTNNPPDIDVGTGPQWVGFKYSISIPVQSDLFSLLNADFHCNNISYRAVLATRFPSGYTLSGSIANLSVNGVPVAPDGLIIPLGTAGSYNVQFSVLVDCPPNATPDSSSIIFVLTVQAVCDDCDNPVCVKSIGCEDATSISVHCSGVCNSPVNIDPDLTIERITYGWANKSDYPDNPITNASFFANNRSELWQLYPFDLFEIHANGKIDANNVEDHKTLIFEIATNHLPTSEIAHLFDLEPFEYRATFTGSNGPVLITEADIPTNLTYVAPKIIEGAEMLFYEFRLDEQDLFSMGVDVNSDNWEIEMLITLRSNPQGIVGSYKTNIRCQFMSESETANIYSSCDPYWFYLYFLYPDVIVEQKSNSENISLSNDSEINPALSIPDSLQSWCSFYHAIGIKHRGGFGDAIDDFPLEFRPLTRWSDQISLQNPYLQIQGLYNNGFAPTSFPFTNSISGVDQLPPTEKGEIISPHFQGIALKIAKDCPNSTDGINSAPEIEINRFAYIHNGHQLASLPPPLTLNSVAASATVPNLDNQWCDAMIDLGGTATRSIPNGTYSFDFQLNPPPSAGQGLPVAIRARLANTNIPVSIGNWTFSSLTPVNSNGWYLLTSGIHSVEDVSFDITLGENGCYTGLFHVIFEWKVFCESTQLDAFATNPESAPSCMQCTQQRSFVRDMSPVIQSNTFSNESCDLVWTIDVFNPETHPSLTASALEMNISTGLVFQGATLEIVCPDNSSTTVETVSEQVSFTDEDVPPSYNYALLGISADNLNVPAGCTLRYVLRFGLSGRFCTNLAAPFNYVSLTVDDSCDDSFTIDDVIVNESQLPAIASEIANNDCCLKMEDATVTYPCNSPNGNILYTNYLEQGDLKIQLSSNGLEVTLPPDESYSFNNLSPGIYKLDITNMRDGGTFTQQIVIEERLILAHKKATDLLENPTTSPSVKPEYQSWVSIEPGGSAGNIHLTFNTGANQVGTISIVGDFTVDVAQVNIQNSEFIFSECGFLRFTPNSEANHLLINQQSYLHACDDKLWGGIHVNGSGNESLEIRDSRVEDAIWGVSAYNNATIVVEDNIFNKNYTHLFAWYGSNMSGSTVNRNKFLCTTGSTPDFNQLPDTLNQMPSCGAILSLLGYPDRPYITNNCIRLFAVNGLSIDSNRFQHAYTGIYSVGSNYSASYNVFKNMYPFFNPKAYMGFGSASSQSLEIDDPRSLELGTAIHYINSYPISGIGQWSLNLHHNIFSELMTGVRVLNSPFVGRGINSSRINITNNLFYNQAFYSDVFSAGLRIFEQDKAIDIRGLTSVLIPIGSQYMILSFSLVSIISNTITNFTNGVYMDNNQLFTMNISNNELNASNLTVPTRIMRRAINLRNTSSGSIPPQTIRNNTFGYAGLNHNGDFNPTSAIVLFNSGNSVVDSNTIHANRQYAQTVNGIVSQASNRVTIRGNRPIEIAGTAKYGPTAYASGVWINGSGDNRVCDNEMTGFGSGLTISGQSPRLMVRCNDFNNNLYSGVNIVNGNFGSQGSMKNPTDNRWTDADGAFRIRGALNLNNPDPHQWWFRNDPARPEFLLAPNDQNTPAANVFVTPFFQDQPPTFTTATAASDEYECDFVLPDGSGGPCDYALPLTLARYGEPKSAHLRDSLLGAVVYGINPDTISSLTLIERYTTIRRTFLQLKGDSTWLYTGDASDSSYQAFYNKCLNLPMGRQEQVWQQLNSTAVDSLTLNSLYAHYADSLFSPYAGDDGLSQYLIDSLFQAIDSLASMAMVNMEQQRISSALAENSMLSTVHPAEGIYQDVLDVFGNTWAKGTYELSAADSSILNGIAFLSAVEYGDAVYIARMLLDTLVHDPEPPARFAEQIKQEKPAPVIQVYPNPASTAINVRITGEVTYPVELRIIDLSGRIVQKESQYAAEQQYTLDNLAAGTYLYEILNHSGLQQRGKLVLTRR